MIAGKITRKLVPPKCNRGEFKHHAQRQVSIGHSYRIHPPTRLQGTRKPVARVSPNRPPPSPPIMHRCQRKPTPSHLVPLFEDKVPGTFSLDVPHPLTVFTHRPPVRLVRVVVRPTCYTAINAHVPVRWGVGSRRLCCFLCAVLILSLPQLVRGSRATCRRACMLLSWARTRIYCRGLQNVRTWRV